MLVEYRADDGALCRLCPRGIEANYECVHRGVAEGMAVRGYSDRDRVGTRSRPAQDDTAGRGGQRPRGSATDAPRPSGELPATRLRFRRRSSKPPPFAVRELTIASE